MVGSGGGVGGCEVGAGCEWCLYDQLPIEHTTEGTKEDSPICILRHGVGGRVGALGGLGARKRVGRMGDRVGALGGLGKGLGGCCRMRSEASASLGQLHGG